MLRLALIPMVALLVLPTTAQAATEEQRLAANITGVVTAFTGCGRPTVHLHADEWLNATYPTDPNVKGAGRNCEVWIRGGLPAWMFREVLYHETYHATHCGCEADHSVEMDRALKDALTIADTATTTSRARPRAHAARRAFLRHGRKMMRQQRRAVRRAR